MSLSILAVLIPLLIVGQGNSAPAPRQINRAIEQLGDDSFAVRQQASRFLWGAGKAVEPALAKAINSNDVEVAVRASRILGDFRYGLYPDTPESLVPLINRFRYGDLGVKRQVLKKLMETGDIPTLEVLLKSPASEDMRKELSNRVLNDASSVVPRLLTAGDSTTVERLLELGAKSDRGMRNYAVYFLLQDQIDAKISRLKGRLGDAPDTDRAKLLAYLLWAKGNLNGARLAADKASDTELLKSLLIELGNWAWFKSG